MPASVSTTPNKLEDREGQHGVNAERQHREHTRQPVEDDHEEGDRREADGARRSRLLLIES